MSATTSGSAFSLMVMPAVVWGTKTVQRPSGMPVSVTLRWTSAVMSAKWSRRAVRMASSFMPGCLLLLFDAGFVGQDAFEDGFCEPVAVGGVEKFFLLGGVAEEAGLDEDGGAGGFAEDGEMGTADATVVGTGGAEEGFLDAVGEPDVLFVVAVAGIGFLVAGSLPTTEYGSRGDGTGRSEAVGFDTFGVAAGVEVEAEKEVGVFGGGEFATGVEGNESVGAAGEEDAEAAGVELFFESFGEVEGECFFDADASVGAEVVAAVAGIEDDGAGGGWVAEAALAEDGENDSAPR